MNTMITRKSGGIEVNIGPYFRRLENTEVPIGREYLEGYKKHETDLSWIRNERVRAWIVIKLIRGEQVQDILNRYFDKGHLFDEDYKALVA
jgi:hypothetical protein